MQCFTQADEFLLKVKFAFNGIQRIEKSHKNGTVCLAVNGTSSTVNKTRRLEDDASWKRRKVNKDKSATDQGSTGSTGSAGVTGGAKQDIGIVLATGRHPPVGAAEKEKVVEACRKFAEAKRSIPSAQNACQLFTCLIS